MSHLPITRKTFLAEPHCASVTSTRRPETQLASVYKTYVNLLLSDYETLSDRVCISKIKDLNLKDYCLARKLYCKTYHKHCTQCTKMINAVHAVIDKGICFLRSLFQSSFPGVTYNAVNAKHRLLQMPLVTLLLKINKEVPKLYVMALIPGVDYEKIVVIFESSTSTTST